MVTKWINRIENAKFSVKIASFDNRVSPIYADAKEDSLVALRRNAIRYLANKKNPQRYYIKVYDRRNYLVGTVAIIGEPQWFRASDRMIYFLKSNGTLGRRIG